MKKIIYILIAVALVFVANRCSRHKTPIKTETINEYSATVDSNGDTIPITKIDTYIYNYDKKGRIVRYQWYDPRYDIYHDNKIEYSKDKVISLTTNHSGKIWYEDGVWYKSHDGNTKICDFEDTDLKYHINSYRAYHIDIKSEERDKYYRWTKRICQRDNKFTIATREIIYHKITPSIFIRNFYTNFKTSCILHLNMWGIIDDDAVYNYVSNNVWHSYGEY
jgi:hypothetical protein